MFYGIEFSVPCFSFEQVHRSSFSDPWCDFLSKLREEKKLGNAGSPSSSLPGGWEGVALLTVFILDWSQRACWPKAHAASSCQTSLSECGQRRSEAVEFWWVFTSYAFIQRSCREQKKSCCYVTAWPVYFSGIFWPTSLQLHHFHHSVCTVEVSVWRTLQKILPNQEKKSFFLLRVHFPCVFILSMDRRV